jgi:hypothetical protein
VPGRDGDHVANCKGGRGEEAREIGSLAGPSKLFLAVETGAIVLRDVTAPTR